MATAPTKDTNRQACCMATALEDRSATYCLECGKPLLRCMAFQECGGIVDDTGLCPVCVRPHLQITPGASLRAPVGGTVSVPFDLVNASGVDRPLFIKGLWSREESSGASEWREERLGWEKLLSGERAAASVTARELGKPGSKTIEIMFTVATQWRTRQEHFAFSTRLLLDIPAESHESGPTIQISSENQMNGNIIQLHEREQRSENEGKIVEVLDMRIRRLDKEERELGLRGNEDGTRVPRSTRFEFTGFLPDRAPSQTTPIITPDAMLVFGRAPTREHGGDADVRLLVVDEQGEIDEAASRQISRRHFEVYIENERPMLRVAGQNGVRVNGKAFGPDKIVMLHDGDVIAPLVADPDHAQLHLRFRREIERIAGILVTRVPEEREKTA